MNPLQLMKMLQEVNNPMQMMQNMFGGTPQFQRVMQMANGKSPQQLEQVCRNMCGQIGLNFDQTLAQFKQMGLNVPQGTFPPQNGK